MKPLIRLFKAVEIPKKTGKKKRPTKELLRRTIDMGYVFAPEVIANYSEDELIELAIEIEGAFGLSPEQMNSSFHKSWKKVRDTDIEQLIFEQILHYLSTYGMEALGFYSDESIYIPPEKLDIPELKDGIRLIVIRGMTKPEIKKQLWSLIQSGVAFKKDTVIDIADLAEVAGFNESEIKEIKNKEVKISLYLALGLVPENPTEFLRYVIYFTTGQTLLIKNRTTRYAIKEGLEKFKPNSLFVQYRKEHGLEKLAQIFYRFKPLFLAFRYDNQMKSVINKIRKLAKKNHKPMPPDYLNDVTAKLKKGERINSAKLTSELNKVNTFRKIRLANALKFRTKNIDSIIYKIRNGKAYSTDFAFKKTAAVKRILSIVLESIAEDIKPKVKGKRIHIPENIFYALPATEKQFTGDFPSGTYITVPKDMIVGVHWEDTDNHRVDLDLSMINEEQKIGWDASYRTDGSTILFSGDVTAAPKPEGASELFYVKRQVLGSYLVIVNFYNLKKGLNNLKQALDVPVKIFVARESPQNLTKNYMVDPNNVVCVSSTNINERQKLLGLLVTTARECRFYFSEAYLGDNITSTGEDWMKNAVDYLFASTKTSILLKDVFEKAGAILVEDKEGCDIDLSHETLDKGVIIGLLTNGNQNG